MSKSQPNISLGKVIVYGSPTYSYDPEEKDWVRMSGGNDMSMVDILDIQEIQSDRIITSKYVLPLADGVRSTSNDGIVYTYCASLPYLTETAHLAEVEKNTIISQAFLYAGRNTATGKTSPLVWVMVGVLGLMALIGMFK